MTTDAPPLRRARHERVYGLNACLAVFRTRPSDIQMAYLLESRLPDLKACLQWLATERKPYRLVQARDLEKLSEARHHEGVVFDTLSAPEFTFDALMDELAAGRKPARLLLLDGVGNPHNLGAILRTAAHFGVRAALVPSEREVSVPPAARRVAEGGAETVPVVAIASPERALAALGNIGFSVVGTAPRGARPLYAERLPKRVVFLLGAERDGVSAELAALASRTVTIPGTGAVESVNVSCAAAILLAEHWRQATGAKRAKRRSVRTSRE